MRPLRGSTTMPGLLPVTTLPAEDLYVSARAVAHAAHAGLPPTQPNAPEEPAGTETTELPGASGFPQPVHARPASGRAAHEAQTRPEGCAATLSSSESAREQREQRKQRVWYTTSLSGRLTHSGVSIGPRHAAHVRPASTCALTSARCLRSSAASGSRVPSPSQRPAGPQLLRWFSGVCIPITRAMALSGDSSSRNAVER
eukprot:m51a1_g12598 hypothetical protein (200) ;mRNA; r:3031-4025